MDIQFKNPEVQEYYDENVRIPAQMVVDGIAICKPETAQRELETFTQAIDNIQVMFPEAKDDIATAKDLRALLLKGVVQFNQPDPYFLGRVSSPVPVGINRPKGFMNCGFNAILQCIMNTTSLKAAIGRSKTKVGRTLSTFVDTYTLAQNGSKGVAETIDSQQMRRLLADGDYIQSDHSQQVDAYDIWEKLSTVCSGRLTFNQTYLQDGQEPSERKNDEPVIRFSLNESPERFDTFMNSYFSEMTAEGGLILKSFNTMPNTLVIQADRTAWTLDGGQRNLDTPLLDVPDVWTAGREITPEGEGPNNYHVKGCVIQNGVLTGGHFISLQKKPDGWYVIDDSVVRKVSNREAKQLLSQGYLFFYEKEDPSEFQPVSLKSHGQSCGSTAFRAAAAVTLLAMSIISLSF